MSDGNRNRRLTALETLFCVLALFGLIWIGYGTGRTFGIETGRDEVTAREHYEREKKAALAACAETKDGDAVECATKAIEAAQENSESRQDLYAQQDMSKWAFWMLVASAATFAVTALGVWFVRRTLDATLEAVEDTGRATKAMFDANDIAKAALAESRRIGEAQARAYLSLSLNGLHFNPLDGRGKVVGRATNTGATPAVDVKVFAKGKIYCDGKSVQELAIQNHEIFDWAAVAGQTYQVVTLDTQPLLDSIRQLGLEEQLIVWIEARFAFTDAFGSRIESHLFFRGKSCPMNQRHDIWFNFECKSGSLEARHPKYDGKHRDEHG
jgi:hypothetical protein